MESSQKRRTPDIEEVWRRIEEHEGEVFQQKTGGEFSYRVKGSYLTPDRTEYHLSKGDFAKALSVVPLDGPGQIRDLVRGPSYIYSLLMDPRIRGQDL